MPGIAYVLLSFFFFFFFNDTATTEIYTLSLHDALPISFAFCRYWSPALLARRLTKSRRRSEEHTSELQSLTNLVCRLLLEKKNTNIGWYVNENVCQTYEFRDCHSRPT